MKTLKLEYVKRFDDLYHLLIKRNLTATDVYPNELKELSTLDISVINIIALHSDIIVREIAESLNIPNSTLTSSLNRLEKKGIANRVISKRDRRSFGVTLAEKGWKVQQIHLDFEKSYFESILSKLDTDEEIQTFLNLFEKIVNHQSEDN